MAPLGMPLCFAKPKSKAEKSSLEKDITSELRHNSTKTKYSKHTYQNFLQVKTKGYDQQYTLIIIEI